MLSASVESMTDTAGTTAIWSETRDSMLEVLRRQMPHLTPDRLRTVQASYADMALTADVPEVKIRARGAIDAIKIVIAERGG